MYIASEVNHCCEEPDALIGHAGSVRVARREARFYLPAPRLPRSVHSLRGSCDGSAEYHSFRSPEAKEQYLRYYNDKAEQRWPVASENKLVETLLWSIFVHISGPKDAPPLVLLPAAASISLMWGA